MGDATTPLAIAGLAEVVCLAICVWLGHQKGRPTLGWICGLLLGPIGVVIMALTWDARRKCPRCGTPMERWARVCPGCRAEVGLAD